MDTTIRLKAVYREYIRTNTKVRNMIAIAVDKSSDTVSRWCRNNDAELTMEAVLNVVRKEMKLAGGVKLTEVVKIEKV